MASSIQKVRSGKAVFERDGVTFDHEEYNYSLLAALFYMVMHEQKLNVLDFGGSLGSTYFQNRKLLKNIPVKWNVVEQEKFVDYGRKYIPEINFYYKISDLKNEDINCILISGSIMYVDNPYKYLTDLLSINAKYMIIDRTYFNFEFKDRIVIEYVPETIYKAVYPAHLININEFGKMIDKQYNQIFYMPQLIDRTPFIEGNTAKITPCHGWFLLNKNKAV